MNKLLKRNTIASMFLALTLILTTGAAAADDPKKPMVDAKTEAERLQGVWLFEAAAQGKKNMHGLVWTSKLTVAGDSFTLPKFFDTKKDLKGKIELDPAANPKTVDLNMEEFDLSEVLGPVKIPSGVMPGIYTLDGERLTICINAESGGKRPTKFDANEDWIVRLTLVKAPSGFKEFPKEFTVKVTDPDGKPATGATLAGYMRWSEDLEAKKDRKPEWEFFDTIKIGADGTATVKFEDLQRLQLIARDAKNNLMAIVPVSPVSLLNGDLHIRLQPKCKVVGTIVCDQLKKLGKSIEWPSVMLMRDGDTVAECGMSGDKFEFFAPPGKYTLNVRGSNLRGKAVAITVPGGQSEFVVEPIALKVTNLMLLQGKRAPELDGVVGWKGDKVKLADLKGKYVLLEFWGYWCGPCVESMPILVELHEKFADKGLAIIGIHVDGDGEIDTGAKLDVKIAGYRKALWKDKDLPFPVALTSGKRIEEGDEKTRGGTAGQYGIFSFPTTILIDREGNVVGRFHARDAKTACAEIEKLLNKK